jgi:hypothetical protein
MAISMNAPGTLRLGRLELPIEEASWQDTGNSWSVNIQAAFCEEIACAPFLEGSLALETTRPERLMGRVVRLDLRGPPEDDPPLMFYVGIHRAPSDATLEVHAAEGTRVRVRICGHVDVEWDEDLDREVPFEVNAWLSSPTGSLEQL